MKRITCLLVVLVFGLVLGPGALGKGTETQAPAAPPNSAGAPAADAPAPMTDIHDIRPPVPVGIDAPWLVPVLWTLAAVAVLVVAWWLWRKHRKPRVIETIVPELPPEMIAMRALDELADVRRLDGKTFYFGLSAILRQYLFERFRVDAPEMTVEELLPCIDGLSIDKDLARQLKQLCRTMDPVKFGGAGVTEKQMETDLLFARGFVRQTTQALVDETRPPGEEMPRALPETA